jgi:isochorismate pyruvate lyase
LSLSAVQRPQASSASPYEASIGFCRAIRAGDRILVSGTAPVEPDGSSTPGDAEAQAARCLELIERALSQLGLDRTRITRTRMFVTDISRWAEFGRAHAAFFGAHRPTTTMVQVSALIDPAMLIEIEADAVA